jgi:hypothetical protein
MVAVGAQPSQAAFPGENGQIVFTRYDYSAEYLGKDIWTINSDGTGLHRLTYTPEEYEYSPTWSPDGSQIAFTAMYADGGQQEVWVMDADGSNRSQVTDLPEGWGAVHVAWSPGGDRFVIELSYWPASSTDLYLVNLDGSGLTQITDYQGSEMHPAWSPDGSRIAFYSYELATNPADIWTVAPDGSDLTQITNDLKRFHNPTWSPDGSQIACSEYDGLNSVERIWVMGADGSNAIPITEDEYNIRSGEPAWSPDATRLVYTRHTDIVELWVMGADGSVPTSLGVDGEQPDWQPIVHYPVAVDDGPLEVARGGTLNVPPPGVLTNDTDLDGDPLTAVQTSPASHGTALLNDDGSFTYTPELGFSGLDSFTYRAADGTGLSNVATVTIAVQAGDTVGLVDPGAGKWFLRSESGAVTSFFYGNPGDLPILGDWDGDGTATPGLYRQSDGFFYSRNSNTTGIADAECFAGDPSDVPIAGDWDGDGDDNLGIYRPSEQKFYLYTTTCTGSPMGAAQIAFLFGNPGDNPVAGDWDGDGIDEVGLHRESTGFFYWRNTLNTGVADGEIFFGDPGDRFVSGDWGTVDGKDTPGLFRPSDVTFYFRHTLTQGVADSSFAWTGAGSSWLPVSGRFSLPGVVW